MRIATPCDRRWEELTGAGEQVRFCAQCEKRVFNLSAMTSDEGEALLKRKRAGICVYYEQSAAGTPLSLDQRSTPLAQQPAAFALAAAALIAMSAACSSDVEPAESPPVAEVESQEVSTPAAPPLLSAAEQRQEDLEREKRLLRQRAAMGGLPPAQIEPCRLPGKPPKKGKKAWVIRENKTVKVEERELRVCGPNDAAMSPSCDPKDPLCGL